MTRHRTLSWIILITTISCRQGMFCPMTTTNCSQFQTACTIYRDVNCSGSHYSDDTTTSYPGPVTSFRVRTRRLINKRSGSSLEVSWKLPSYDSHIYLTGFEVTVWSTVNPDVGCFVYNLSGSQWTEPASKYEYVYFCASLADGQYNIEVISLPISETSDVTETAIVRVISRDKDCNRSMASCWTTDVVVYNRPCNRLLLVKFQMAPDEARISQYLVTLINKDSFVPDVSVNISHVSSGVAGHAVLNITRPLPLNQRIVTIRPQGETCELNNCLISATEPFDINDPTKSECTFNYGTPYTEDGGLSTAALTGIIIGSVVVTAALVCIIVFTAKMGIGIRKVPVSLYVTYSYDNEYHHQVIEHLVTFLESACHCNVIYDKIHQDHVPDGSLWVKDAIERSDRILFVTSEGCYRRLLLIQNNEISPATDTFTQVCKLLEEDVSQGNGSLMNKLILIHFSYTPPQYRVCSLLRHQVNYQLMADVVEVYRLIHGSVTKHDASHLSKHKNKLSRYIDSTTSYVQSNPNWFTDNYGNPSANSHAFTTWIDLNHSRFKDLGMVSPPAGYLNLNVLTPRVQDDNATITSSVLCDMVDEINIGFE